ncbi:unnamed protein product [Linum tenue]|uniref:Uncharacterized protein n=1 Tax=Linum tenue TaxID=586396 RepID=A0AAV0QJF6_9ROSI|nr:unnamed protein product [Linum tenue]
MFLVVRLERVEGMGRAQSVVLCVGRRRWRARGIEVLEKTAAEWSGDGHEWEGADCLEGRVMTCEGLGSVGCGESWAQLGCVES